MNLTIFSDRKSLAGAAAGRAATAIRDAIKQNGIARIIAATGTTQFAFLEELTAAPGIDWKKVEVFHLDEYIGLPATHPASFEKYLLERLIDKVGIVRYHLLDGEGVPQSVIADVTREISKAPVDIAFMGIGENGHLAFNDPPADFETEDSFIVVSLDEASRRQQYSEGWFDSLEGVPRQAITMTIREILKARQIICLAQGTRKAEAVEKCFQGEISPLAPASALRTHSNAYVYLDKDAAALLRPELLSAQVQVLGEPQIDLLPDGG